MKIIAFFTQSGIPKTGLIPTIRIRNLTTGNLVITDESMVEKGDGFYSYDFTTYNENEDYCIRADGTNTLNNSERYVYSTNETAGIGNILKIEKGNWEIKDNQMIFYDTDGITELYKFNLQTKLGVATETDVFKRLKV